MIGYDLILLDVDGVIFDAGREIAGASDALRLLDTLNKELVFVTNNVAKPKPQTQAMIQSLVPGLSINIVDPVDVLLETILRERPSLKEQCCVIGPRSLRKRLANLGFGLVEPVSKQTASLVLVSSTVELDYEALCSAVRMVLDGAVLAGTGRDRLFSWRGVLWPSTGAVLAAFETAASCEAVVVGKPEPEIFRMAAQQYGGPGQAVVVGDDCETDVRGAYNAGFESALVQTGISQQLDHGLRRYEPTHIFKNLLEFARALGDGRSV